MEITYITCGKIGISNVEKSEIEKKSICGQLPLMYIKSAIKVEKTADSYEISRFRCERVMKTLLLD